MPKIERWENFPGGSPAGFDRSDARTCDWHCRFESTRLRIDTKPEVPAGDWYKDFGSFKICGAGALAKTFLLRGQMAKGGEIS